MRSQFADRCVFGLASMQGVETARKPLAELVTWLGERAEIALSTKFLDSYAHLAKAVRQGALDVAWLPPVIYVALQRGSVAQALVSNHRAGQAAFHGVLLVRAGARVHTLDGLRGMRAAWVDPCSASGYVIPRMEMAAMGVDPRTAFSEQLFVGSHDAAVHAVVDGDADVAATFARVDGAGNVTAGSWTQIEGAHTRVRVLWTFGAIPSDVMAARADYAAPLRERLTEAFVAATRDPQIAPIAQRLFGVEEFRRGHMRSYASFRRAIEQASQSALIDDLHLASL